MKRDNKLPGVMDITEPQDLPAGNFSAWLHQMEHTSETATGMNVPCGECNACCRSSYFINIGVQETETLARIPRELLSAAPGLAKGNMVMGFTENGHCPMLVDNSCSIYEHRPLTCRNYDCRIFPATSIEMVEDDKALISQRTRRWRFSYPTQLDRDEHSAVQAAAKFLTERAERLDAHVPGNSTQLALLAIKVHDVFLDLSDEDGSRPADCVVAEAIRASNP